MSCGSHEAVGWPRGRGDWAARTAARRTFGDPVNRTPRGSAVAVDYVRQPRLGRALPGPGSRPSPRSTPASLPVLHVSAKKHTQASWQVPALHWTA